MVERRKGPKIQRQRFETCASNLSNSSDTNSVEMRQGALCEPAGGESGLEEDGKMEIDGKVDSKKRLDQRKKVLQKQLREIEMFTDILKGTQEIFRETWQQDLPDIEQRRNDLLPEQQKLQKSSQALQSLQDRKKQCQKDAGKCAEEMELVRNEIAGKSGSISGAGTENREEILGRRGSG